jgi:hypothetical protein
MDARIQVVAIVAASALILVVLDLVRRRRLLERYALLWLFSGAILLGLAIWRDLLAKIADLVGVAYPPNALFLIAFGFVLVLLLHFSLAVSKMSDQIKVLAQRLALLDEHVRNQEQAAAAERDRSDAEAFIRD